MGGESGSFGGVEIVNGYNIDIKNNNFQNVLGTTPYNPAFAVNVKPDGGTHGVRDVVISDNQVNDSDILVASDTSYPALATNITVTGNTMDGDVSYTKSASIKVGCAYGTPAGGIKISDNEIEIFSTGIAIELTASSDSADYYEITNNRIQCGDSVGKGISINGQTAPVNIDGNHFSSKNINTQPAIDDNNASTPITFGTNTFYNYPTKYDVGSGHVCYLGDKFDSTIGGDTSCHANMVVNNNLTVLGNVVNTTISNLLQSMITGLNTGTRPYNSDSTDFVVTTGTAGTKTLSGTPYMTTLSTDMTKSISASSTWSAGNMGQARPSGVTMYGSRIYHMFLLGKSSDPTAADIGIDSVPKPVNLLADSGVVSAGYNTYRRVGSMKWGTYSWPDSTTVAQYVSGFWTNGDTHWERIVSPYVQFDVTTANAFSYHQPDLPSNIPITAILVVTSDKEAGQSVLLGATTNKTNQAIFTDPAIGEYQEFYIDTLDATVWGDFNVYGGSGSMSVYSGVSGWIDHRNKDRTDNF